MDVRNAPAAGDERPFEQRQEFEESRGCHALTDDDRLVRIVEYVSQHYWGGKRFLVQEVQEEGGPRTWGGRWHEEDEDLTPAFPEEPSWRSAALARRAHKQAAQITSQTAPAPNEPGKRRI